MEIGLVRKIDIDREMQQAYLDYAMSVIVARALPDARDGLKPVHRRILYAMHDMGIRPGTDYKKSARIVGEVLGKYHPHGDMAVYDAMARMAQDFSMRYALVDGQGNFGSIDGDAPAAMRYTEARITRMAADILTDLEKDTVDFAGNFDGTLKEPQVLPAAVPNLMINGATGIAVGMATSVPPHNLGEVCDALTTMLDRWTALDDVTVEDLMKFVQGPDFPTGGLILSEEKEGEGLAAAYGSGRGRITVQARVHTEEMERGRTRIIITEIPFQTNKSSLIERIADLARDNTLEGISDLRDESDRQGMRIVIELNRNADPEKVLAGLYKRTPLRGTFSIIMLALVNDEPRLLSLKQMLKVFLDHRLEVVRRRSEYELRRAKERAHILEGLLVALNNLDEVIKIIRAARDGDEARTKLCRRFKLSVLQADAILDMPLRRLAALERKKIETEYKEKVALIKHLEGLLASPRKVRALIAEELRGLKSTYGDRRRTQIVTGKDVTAPGATLTMADLVPEQQVWVTLSADGLLARAPAGRERIPMRFPKITGGVLAVVQANTRDVLYLLSERGQAATVPVHSIPEHEDLSQGVPFRSLSAFPAETRIVAAVSVSPELTRPASGTSDAPESGGAPGGYLLLASQLGMVKRVALSDLPGPSAQAFAVMGLAEDDFLGWARLTSGEGEVLLVTAHAMAIRFKEEQVRPMGLPAAGVLGIKLAREDEWVVGMDVVRPGAEVLLAAGNGQGKRIALKEFPTQGRYGMGVQAWKLPPRTALIGAVIGAPDERTLLLTGQGDSATLKLEAAPRRGRSGRGAALLKLKKGDSLMTLTPALAGGLTGASGGSKPAAKKRATKGAPKKAAAKKPAAPKAEATKAGAGKEGTEKPAAKKPAPRKPASKSAADRKPAASAKKPLPRKPAAKHAPRKKPAEPVPEK